MALTKDKNELLSRLYSLRAGLSLVSKEKQIVDEIFQKAETTKSTELYKARISDVTPAYNELTRIEAEYKAMQEDFEDTEKKLKPYEKDYRNAKKNVITFSIVLSLIIGIFLALTVGILVIDMLPNYFAILIWLLPIVPFNPVGIGTWLCAFFLRKNIKKFKQAKTDYLFITDKYIRLSQQLPAKKKQLDYANTRYEEANKKFSEKRVVIESNYIKDRAEADPHLLTAKATIESLNEEYGDFLDPRDWENLDIIIFSIETQRADNLKDALSIVDSEKRTDRITDAIHLASKEICATMEDIAKKMHNSLKEGFTGLSRQITAQAKVLSHQIGQVGSMVSAQSEYLQMAASEAALNNALLEKANKSSQELANDLKSIKSDTKYLKDKN